jgi:hypothetical protein
MTGFRLQLKTLPDGRLTFTIPIGYKILLLGIGLLILISLIVTRAEGGGDIFIRENTIPLIICLISLLGAAYHECWIFDREAGQVIHQNGLIGLHGNKVYRIAEFKQVEVSRRLSRAPAENGKTELGLLRHSGLNLVLLGRDGKNYRLETYRAAQSKKVGTIARQIADYCDLRFIDHTVPR